MSKMNDDIFAIWEKRGENEFRLQPTRSDVRPIDEDTRKIIAKIIENCIENGNYYISMERIIKELDLPGDLDSIIKSKARTLRSLMDADRYWKALIESRIGKGYRIKKIELIEKKDSDNTSNNEYIIKIDKAESIPDKAHINIQKIKSKRAKTHREDPFCKNESPSIDYDDSLFIGESPADGISCLVGEEFRKTWTIRNVGTQIWHKRFMRCSPLPEHVTVNRQTVEMPDILPGEEFTLDVTYMANDEGRYYSEWRIYKEDGQVAFPEKSGVGVTLVVNPNNASSNANQITKDSKTPVFPISRDIPITKTVNVTKDADLLCCCYPSAKCACKCNLLSDNSFILEYDFESNQRNNWPDFISGVFRFYDDLNLLAYYASNNNLKLRFEIVMSSIVIDKIQVEFQTENNRVIGSPVVKKIEKNKSIIEIPLSDYAKYVRDIKRIQNLCFIFLKNAFLEPKGTIIINNISLE